MAFYDNSNHVDPIAKSGKKYASTIAEVERIYGPNAVKRAAKIFNERADDTLKRTVSSTQLGNDPATIHKILEFGDRADQVRNQTSAEAKSETFYDNPKGRRASLKGRFEKLEMDLTDEFRERVIQPAKQDLIDREGPLEVL